MMKQHISSRLFLTAIIALFACVSIYAQTHLNPFAYRLDNMVDRNTYVNDDSKGLLMNDHYTIEYALSGPATSVIVRFWNDATSTWSRDGGNTGTALAAFDITNKTDAAGNPCKDKGYHTYTLDFTDIVGIDTSFNKIKDIRLRWTIDVKGGNQNNDLVQRTCTVANTTTTSTTTDKTITTKTTYPTYKFIEANEVSDIKKFRRVGGVDICNDPYSYNFGAIFCTEAKREDLGDDATYVSYNTTPGVYVFGGGMERLYANWKGTNIACYPVDWNSTTSQDFSEIYYAMAPHRVRLSDDGKVFVSAISKGTVRIISQITRPADQDGNNFYEPNDEGGGYNHNIFNPAAGSYNTTTCLWTTSGGAFMLAPNVAMDVQGKWGENGENLKLLLISAQNSASNYPGSVKNDSYISEYNFGSNTTWSNTAPTVLIPGNTLTDANKVKATDGTKLGDLMLLGYQNTNIEYDPKGGFWFVQNRTHDPLAVTMLHYNYNSGVIDREEHAANRSSGGVRHNHNFTKLAVPGGYPKDSAFFQYSMGGKKYNYNAKTVETGYITIYNVSYNSNGSYNFTDSAYIKNKYGDDVCDFAWDFADNLYVANKKALVALALPHKNKTVSTPCRDSYEYALSPVHEFAYEINPTVAGLTTPYATITHPRINGAPYPRYLQNANVTLVADIISGCKLYKWVENIFDKSTNINSNAADNLTNKCVISSMVEKEKITAHIGLCVYEDTTVLDIQKETTFPAAFVKRELDNANYSTICLPFDLETLEGTPWEGATVLRMNSVTSSGEGNDKVTTINFIDVFKGGEHIEARRPYLIKLADNAENISATDEKIFLETRCPKINNLNEYGGLTDGSTDETSATARGVAFHGVLNPSTIPNDANTLFLVADNRLATIVGKSTVNLKGLRAFFTVNPNIVPGKIQLRLPEKTVTSVPTFGMDTIKPTKYFWNGKIYIQRGNNVYDLSGNCVR